MKREVDRLTPKTDRVAGAIVVVVGLCVLMMFTLLYTLTPPTTAMVEHHVTMNQQ
jgi:hypothetical protein